MTVKPFGESAPRNFDKERPGPGREISEQTQREIDALEQYIRAGRAIARRRNL